MRESVTDEEVAESKEKIELLLQEINQVLFGQEAIVELVVIGLLGGGHILLEGLPGLGKTALVKGLAKAVDLQATRIQFTPDLLPGDITGNPVLQEIDGRRKFVFQQGPIFGNLVLADEINRASPKTQSALLEAMQEYQVTVVGDTRELPKPFFVLATQNPIELEGTYPLPEAQVDRFLFKLEIHRNSVEVLKRIVQHRNIGSEPPVNQVMTNDTLLNLITQAHRIYLPDVVADYIARLVDATHGQSESTNTVRYGASPRAALSLAAAAKARALVHGRVNASFEDVQSVATAVLQHRLVLDYHAKLHGHTGKSVVEALLQEVATHDRDLPRILKNVDA